MIDHVHTLAVGALGLYAGALLTEGAILVPYWRRMAAPDFFRLHHTMGPGLFAYFAPLTTVAVLLAIASAGVSLWSGEAHAGRLLAGLGGAAALALFFLYFQRANRSFADHSLSDEALAPELARWAFWHWVRTVIVVAAFAAAVWAL